MLFPEAFLGTYPKGLTFDAPVGRRLPEGREEFPVFDQAAVLYADLDNATLIKSKMDFDPVGHYARADVFSLKVDRSPKVAVQF